MIIQGHIVISGGENGFLAVWDLRQGKHPTTLLSAHQVRPHFIYKASNEIEVRDDYPGGWRIYPCCPSKKM